jgi:MFS family permease
MISSPAFFLALASNVLFWLSLQVLYPPLPLYIASIGGTPADNGLATFGAAGGAVLSRLFIGPLTDRFGRFIIPEDLGYIPLEKPDPPP